MNILDFVKKLDKATFDKDAISVVFHSYINSFNFEEKRFDENCKKYFENIVSENFSTFGAKLGTCRAQCQNEINSIDDDADKEYLKKLKSVSNILAQLNSIYSEVGSEKYKKSDNVSATVAQHESSLKEIKDKIASLNSDVTRANNLIDDKIFSLLINTVAILGIFVAIAFTGFGVTSIFSNLDIANASQSISAFIKNVFFILLIIIGSYNLLLLLIYFIFKLSRSSLDNGQMIAKEDAKTNGVAERAFLFSRYLSFSQTINLTPFWIIDAILFVLTVAAFIASIVVK